MELEGQITLAELEAEAEARGAADAELKRDMKRLIGQIRHCIDTGDCDACELGRMYPGTRQCRKVMLHEAERLLEAALEAGAD